MCCIGVVLVGKLDKRRSKYGKSWVTYKKNDNDANGKAIISNFSRDDDKTTDRTVKEVPMSPSIAHNFIIGVDADKDVLWVATSKGVSRGELLK